MKINKIAIDKRTANGYLSMVMEDSEDLWTVYNIMEPDDEVESMSYRKIIKGKDTIKKLLRLRIRVQKCELENPYGGSIRIAGTIVSEQEDVTLGSHHSADLEINKPFTLYKDKWDTKDIDEIRKATDPTLKAEVGAIVMQEGVAHVCLITENMTHLQAKIEISVPRKAVAAAEGKNRERGIERFYKHVYAAMVSKFNFDSIKAIILASPGFTARGFYDYALRTAASAGDKTILQSKDEFLVVSSSNGYLQGLNEAMRTPEVQERLKSTKYASQTAYLDKFFDMLNNNPNRAWYGPKHVSAAVDYAAVDTLLISNRLYKSADVNERRHYIQMAETVKNTGGTVMIFSEHHDAGKQLDDITGIACTLTVPLPELEDIESSDSESDDE